MKLKVIFLSIAMAFAFTGCQDENIKPCDCEPIIINERIPEPAAVSKPSDPVAALKRGDSDEKVAKAYVSFYHVWKLYGEALEKALQPYRDAAARDSKGTTTTTTTTTVVEGTNEP